MSSFRPRFLRRGVSRRTTFAQAASMPSLQPQPPIIAFAFFTAGVSGMSLRLSPSARFCASSSDLHICRNRKNKRDRLLFHFKRRFAGLAELLLAAEDCRHQRFGQRLGPAPELLGHG